MVALPATASAETVAEWRMDEPARAGTMTDSAPAGGSNDGTLSSVTTGVAGLVSGTAYQFDGTTSHVTVADSPALDPASADITVTATVQVADGEMRDDSYDIVRKGVTTTPGGNWKMEIKRNAVDPTVGKLLCVFKGVVGSGRAAVQRVANVDIVDNTAHTLQCMKTSTTVKAVVVTNGQARTFTTTKAAGSIANDQPVILGSKVAGDDVLEGDVDQVTVDIG
ncbi:MAG: hypothetical protein M3Q87_02405 [Actinomycetota bacterium]|nr:hypothetical protein [Actinomycetota bacterium]